MSVWRNGGMTVDKRKLNTTRENCPIATCPLKVYIQTVLGSNSVLRGYFSFLVNYMYI